MSARLSCYHYFISGRVQGVFYRASALQQAQALRISGWVRNRGDGRVEVYACGDAKQHQALKNWLEIGPSQAKVSTIEIVAAEFEQLDQFSIRPTL